MTIQMKWVLVLCDLYVENVDILASMLKMRRQFRRCELSENRHLIHDGKGCWAGIEPRHRNSPDNALSDGYWTLQNGTSPAETAGRALPISGVFMQQTHLRAT
jgi:hypothetical protein